MKAKPFWQDEAPAESRRERRKQEIRGKIIASSIELFEDHGLEDVTLEQICSSADISRPTFYSYYKSKQELIAALGEKLWINVARKVAQDSFTNQDSTTETVISFLKVTRQEITKYGRLERELIRHTMNHEANDSAQNSQMLKALTNLFESIFKEGRKRADIGDRYPIDFLAETTMGCISSIMMNWAFDPDYPVEKRLKQMTDFILQMLLLNK